MPIADLLTDDALVLNFENVLQRMSAHDFFVFCQDNDPLRIERTSLGEIIIMAPAGAGSGQRGLKMGSQLERWAERDGTGVAFDSSTGFILPNGATRSPDLAWVRKERWESLSEDEQEEFAPLCPDFVVELRSKSDRLEKLNAKMLEYIANGAQLGWLIDPYQKRVYVYRPGCEATCLDNPEKVSGEPLLAGFELELAKIW